MAGDRRPVEMVRLEREEEVVDVEEVLGRDAAAVFPSLAPELDPMERLKSSIGAKRFVTESELEQIKAQRGLNVDDGTAAADKPLAEVLQERKRAKQEAFDAQWRQMKTGKNRPLDDDEYEFLDSVARDEAERQARRRDEEAAQLEEYRLAVLAAAEAKAAQEAEEEARAAAAAAGADGAGPGPGSGGNGGGVAAAALLKRGGSGGAKVGGTAGAAAKPLLASIKPLLKVRPKGAAAGAARGAGGGGGAGASAGGGSGEGRQLGGSDGGDNGAAQQRKNEQQQQQQASDDDQGEKGGGGGGLAGLLGYGSGDDDDENDESS